MDVNPRFAEIKTIDDFDYLTQGALRRFVQEQLEWLVRELIDADVFPECFYSDDDIGCGTCGPCELQQKATLALAALDRLRVVFHPS